MSTLTSKSRKALSTSQFALPGRRFPVYDKAHAADAKARAAEMFNKGKLSAAQKATVDAAANRKLQGK